MRLRLSSLARIVHGVSGMYTIARAPLDPSALPLPSTISTCPQHKSGLCIQSGMSAGGLQMSPVNVTCSCLRRYSCESTCHATREGDVSLDRPCTHVYAARCSRFLLWCHCDLLSWCHCDLCAHAHVSKRYYAATNTRLLSIVAVGRGGTELAPESLSP